MNILSGDLARITGGRLVGSGSLPVTGIVIDSRQASYSESQVFFAIKGRNHDGHQFVVSLYGKGLRVFVISELRDEYRNLGDASFIHTSDTIDALQKLAAWKRASFTSPVIAVTGSA
ncbi:MAG TPA: Mur ligase domain-containing protein, partial [Bacteroidales bacterium]|nr:Mur ligase domain-containing protein [Bacteroidales bacterium]